MLDIFLYVRVVNVASYQPFGVKDSVLRVGVECVFGAFSDPKVNFLRMYQEKGKEGLTVVRRL